MSHKSVIIIAEAGVNHNGSFEMAKQLVDKAKEAGATMLNFRQPYGIGHFDKGSQS